MPKKRILLVYATAGTGHKKAALAIKKAFDGMKTDAEIDIIDSLDYTNASFKWSYPNYYIFMVNRIPGLWGFGYYSLDNKIFYSLVSWIRHLVNWINARALAKFMREGNYDVIVSTHFLATDIAFMEGKKRIPARIINVVTDYLPHSFWIAKGIDTYVVAHEKTKSVLMAKYAIPQDKIKVLGIPIDPVFAVTKDKKAIKAARDITEGLFTVLVGSGGFGVGPIVELVKAFKGTDIPMQLLVVCGKNESLAVDIKALAKDMKIRVKVYGYVDYMDELMEAADIIVTKTGGMMSSEALAKDLPIVGIAPIPGQETRNYNILSESGVVLGKGDIESVPGLVEKLYKEGALREEMIARIRRIKNPDAANNIARLAIEAAGG